MTQLKPRDTAQSGRANPILTLKQLGRFEIHLAGRERTALGGKTNALAMALLQLLSLAPGYRATLDVLYRELGLDRIDGPERLDNAIGRLERLLAPVRVEFSVGTREDTVALRADAGIAVDVLDFLKAAERVGTAVERAGPAVERAGGLKRCRDVLAEYPGALEIKRAESGRLREEHGKVEQARERLRQLCIEFELRQIDFDVSQGNLDIAITKAEAYLADKLYARDTRLVVRLVWLLGRGGRWGEAKRHCSAQQKMTDEGPTRRLLEKLDEALKEKNLSALPYPYIHAFLAPIAIVRPGGPTSADSPEGNSSPLIGRQPSLEQLALRLSLRKAVTVIGAPGVGKSRLAREVEHRLPQPTRPSSEPVPNIAEADQGAERAETGPSPSAEPVANVVYLALGDLTPDTDLLQHVLQSFRVKPGTRDPLIALRDELQGTSRLLILDNCEHMRESVGRLVARLRLCEDLFLLLTSREPIGYSNEELLGLKPLSVPPEGTDSWRAANLFESVKFFVGEVQRLRPDFWGQQQRYLKDATPALVDLCRRSAGLPLVLEVWAAVASERKLSELSIVAQAFEQAMRRVRKADGRAPKHHRSLGATLEYAYQRLNDDERRTFRRLGVFAGSWTQQAAAAIVAGSVPPTNAAIIAVGGTLAAMEGRSLVEFDAPRKRYGYLAPIREFALAKLGEDLGEEQRTREWWVAWFKELVRVYRDETREDGKKSAAWYGRLEADYANLHAVLAWVVGNRRGDDALDLSGNLIEFWTSRLHYADGYGWLTKALALPGSVTTQTRAKALNSRGNILHEQGKLPEAEDLYEEAIGIYEQLEHSDPCREISSTVPQANLGNNHIELGQYDPAERYLRDVRARCLDEAQDPATPEKRRSVVLRRAARATMNLARVAYGQGNLDVCLPLFEEAWARFDMSAGTTHADRSTTKCYWGLALLLEGSADEADKLLAEAQAHAEQSKEQDEFPLIHYGQAEVARQEGRIDAARQLLLQAMPTAYAQSWRVQTDLTEAFGVLACTARLWKIGLELLGAAEAQREKNHLQLTAYQSRERIAALEAAASTLGTTRRDKIVDYGRTAPFPKLYDQVRSPRIWELAASTAEAELGPLAAINLSENQKIYLGYLADGLTRLQIAKLLDVSTQAIAPDLRSLQQQLGAQDDRALATWWRSRLE